jgi:RimJ/RimL family protein N-acetyltransferase
MATELLLKDGTRAITWSLLKEDKEGLAEAYLRLGPDSKYHRFLTAVPKLTDHMLEKLVDDVDGIDHVALVLFVFDEEDVATGAAIGRMIRYDDQPDTADIAVTVDESFRGRGIASAMVAELLRQRPHGVRHVLTQVLADNAPSLNMLRHLGPLEVTQAGGNVLEVRVDLPPEEERDDEPDEEGPGRLAG